MRTLEALSIVVAHTLSIKNCSVNTLTVACVIVGASFSEEHSVIDLLL